jgi:methionine synthase II (cobalamin-independent)
MCYSEFNDIIQHIADMEVGVVNVVLTIESVVLRHCVIQKT